MADLSALSKLPGVDRVLQSDDLAPLRDRLSDDYLADFIRMGVEQVRKDILKGKPRADDLMAEVVSKVVVAVNAFLAPSLRRVVNATGVVLHTNMGRAPLPESAVKRIVGIASGYTNLELDLETGERGSRTSLVESLLVRITGGEAAAVVNNNAAAVLLGLNTLAQGKEVVVSRGQLVEIGGSFRIPDIMERSGATMVEVGTTNRTHQKDFSSAITDQTGLLLSVHPSNYEVVGFTSEVALAELVEIGHARNIPILHDLGAGCLIDTRKMGLGYEPLVSDSIEAGANLVTFSGDKILGGPQCGILVGTAEAITKVRENPLMRALRCDKLTYAALEATLQLFLNRESIVEAHPVVGMLTESQEDVRKRAEQLADFIGKIDGSLDVVDSEGQVGSGSLPAKRVASAAVRIIPGSRSVAKVARQLRKGVLPVIGYTRDGALHLDARTIFPDDLPAVAEAVQSAMGKGT
ncbi:MAG: L-seryl-tRNA(Sec) selenium transferase [Candidatus Latescibacterota bacterium]|nr:L-seryl-tRNA(Sec) selenium transferase [Candidatus Latescibacterota bacterium]